MLFLLLDDDENADGQRPHGHAYQHALHPETKQRADFHGGQLRFQIYDDGA